MEIGWVWHSFRTFPLRIHRWIEEDVDETGLADAWPAFRVELY